eukprot:4256229-Lingulodinium_polyedra.AAC.1
MDLTSLATPLAFDSIISSFLSSEAERGGVVGATLPRAPRIVLDNPAVLAIRGMICQANDEIAS